MRIAALLVSFAMLAGMALAVALFVTVTEPPTLFERALPYLGTLIVLLLGSAAGIAHRSRKKPESRVNDSNWLVALVLLLMATGALLFISSVLL